MEMGSKSLQVSSTREPHNRLKFGKKVCLQSNNNNGGSCFSSPSSSSSKSSSTKQPPRCQVEGCSVDLSGAKAYYGRHKVCGLHSKSPMVIVAGLEQRFCQQCSRFHQLPEFDQGKRSCRRRLAGHNERRRKLQQPPPAPLSPWDDSSRLRGFLRSFAYTQLSGRDASTAVRAGDRITGKQWEGGTQLSAMHDPASDLGCAFSLLSSQPLGNAHTAPNTTTTTTSFGVSPDVSTCFMTSLCGFEGHREAESVQLPSELELALHRKKQCMELSDAFNRSL